MSAFGIFVQLSGRIFALPKGVLFAVDHERFSRTPDSAGGALAQKIPGKRVGLPQFRHFVCSLACSAPKRIRSAICSVTFDMPNIPTRLLSHHLLCSFFPPDHLLLYTGALFSKLFLIFPILSDRKKSPHFC